MFRGKRFITDLSGLDSDLWIDNHRGLALNVVLGTVRRTRRTDQENR